MIKPTENHDPNESLKAFINKEFLTTDEDWYEEYGYEAVELENPLLNANEIENMLWNVGFDPHNYDCTQIGRESVTIRIYP